MKLGTYPQGNKALNSLTPKPNWIPSLNPPGVQPSADRCIFLCPGSTRPDNWFKTFWISNNWTLKTKGNLYTTSLNNQQTQLRISQTMNNMYRIQQNTTANIETYEYFGSVHCDLFGTCPHQNLSSNSWHPPHPVDWTNLQQSLNHHLQAEEEDCQHCSAPYLSISQFGSPFWRFKGQHESGLVSVVIEVGKPGAVKSTALAAMGDLWRLNSSSAWACSGWIYIPLDTPPGKQTYKTI